MKLLKKLWNAIATPIMALVVNIKQSKEEGEWDGLQDG